MAKTKTKEKLNPKQRKFAAEIKYNGYIAKIAAAFLVVITAVYPIFVGPFSRREDGVLIGPYESITFDKTLFFWVATGIAVVLLLFMFICAKGNFRLNDYYADDEPERRVTIAEWALLGFIAWSFISAFLSAWLNAFGSIVWLGAPNRYEGFVSYLGYALCFVIIARLYKPRRLHLHLIAGSAVIVSLIGVLQFLGHDIFGLFPFDRIDLPTTDAAGNPLFGPLSAFFRTTLGNVNIVSAYCSFMILLFAALFTVSRSRWQFLYLGAGAASFALSLVTGHSGDAHAVAVLGAMVLLIPYWISNRERLGRILIAVSTWGAVYAAHSAYMAAMQRRFEAGELFAPGEFVPPSEAYLLEVHTHISTALILTVSGIALALGLGLLLLLKVWVPARPMRIISAAILPVMFVGGLIGLEIVGSRLYGSPDSIVWQAREMMHFRLEDDFGSSRGWIWRNAVEVIPQNPIFGTGPDTFEFALGDERQLEAARLYNVRFDKAHNVFLQIAVCMGIPALIAYIIFLGGVFVPAVKHAFNRPVMLVFGAAAVSYVIQSFFCVEVPITTPLVWIALGVVAAETWMAKAGRENIEV